MKYSAKLRAKNEASTYSPVIAPETKERFHDLLNALECMDARTARELERLDKSGAEEDLKEFVRQSIVSRHQEIRLPLQEAAEELRAQFQGSLPEDDH
ncbi:hypothetical protein [Microvirga makkahensis]|uniref:Uncharacterized protein n=1 Tax=Microvirga makkahensis TaxID=1128670 RepID=A0A7X3MP24_9HYPH|nr:hypothetical protein [Microvirga makkahensis]MXQ10606.1 hypothetical protein [Microvirga makkahensis]